MKGCSMQINKKILLVLLASSSQSISSDNRTHIGVPEGVPGIQALFAFRPETAQVIRNLVGILLQKESTLARSDRQLIAAYVSWLNQCVWCCSVHSAVATHLLDMKADIVQAVKDDFESAPISEKLKALLNIAGKVQKGGKQVTPEDIDRARTQGADDVEIHDTVLIAAVFCMNNRYVQGLDAWTPSDPAVYTSIGKILAEKRDMRCLCK